MLLAHAVPHLVVVGKLAPLLAHQGSLAEGERVEVTKDLVGQ